MTKIQRLVLIAGAGASRNLARTGTLALMGDWAKALSGELERTEKGLSGAIGLDDPGISAEGFEETLGAFIRWASVSFPLNQRFAAFGGPKPGTRYAEVNRWLETNERRAKQTMAGLNKSMFSEFGRLSISINKAESAYRRLFEHLGLNSEPIVCATTNYDPALELGLERIGRKPHDGFEPSRWESPTLDVGGLVDWQKGHRERVPVLHLHGAVGWYRRSDGTITQQPADQPFNPTLRDPVFLPPDPDKDPSNDASVAAIWSELEKALQGATHVLVLGHSLNDEPLVDAIKTHSSQARVAVASRSPEPIAAKIEGAKAIPLEFGPDFEAPTELLDWRDGVVHIGETRHQLT